MFYHSNVDGLEHAKLSLILAFICQCLASKMFHKDVLVLKMNTKTKRF